RRPGQSRLSRDGRWLPGLRRGRHHAQGRHRAAHQGRASRNRRSARHHRPRRRKQSVLHAGEDVTVLARLLLLLPTRTYRTEAFVAAAESLEVDLVCASERPSTLEHLAPDSLMTLDFADPDAAARQIAGWGRRPLDAVVGVDDQTATVAAAIAERLGL